MVQHHSFDASECIRRVGTFQSVTSVDAVTDSTAAACDKSHPR